MEKINEIINARKDNKLYIDTFSDAKTKKEYAVITDVSTQEIIRIEDEKVTVEKMNEAQKNKALERAEKEKLIKLEAAESELRQQFDEQRANEAKAIEDKEFDEWKTKNKVGQEYE